MADSNSAADALRFWGGTPSVYPYVVAGNSLEAVNRTGVEHFRAHNIMLADKIIQALSSAVLVSLPEPELRSGTVILHFADRQAALIKRL